LTPLSQQGVTNVSLHSHYAQHNMFLARTISIYIYRTVSSLASAHFCAELRRNHAENWSRYVETCWSARVTHGTNNKTWLLVLKNAHRLNQGQPTQRNSVPVKTRCEWRLIEEGISIVPAQHKASEANKLRGNIQVCFLFLFDLWQLFVTALPCHSVYHLPLGHKQRKQNYCVQHSLQIL